MVLFTFRILSSLGRFQDEVVLPPNTTEPKVYARETFALQVRDVDTKSFSGETFNVDLGSFEEAIHLNTSIPEQALQTTMEVLADATVSITVPREILGGRQNREIREPDETQRLSYSVFIADTLFQSPNQTSRNNLSIGSIIAAIRLRNVAAELTVPLNATFRISEVNNDSCV